MSMLKVSLPFSLFPDPYPDKGKDVERLGREYREYLDRQRNQHITTLVEKEVKRCPCFVCDKRETCTSECGEYKFYYRRAV